jgi:cation diffusion facilitator family transporter
LFLALKIRDRVQTFVLNRKKKSIFGGGVMKPIALAYGSFIVSIIGFFLKLIAYLMTDSVALYADAVESIVNIVAAFFLIIAMSLSQKPADDSHHYGHHKAQYFSVLLESLFIFIAASTIFYDAFQSYMSPNALHFSLEGLLVNGLATSFNAAWGFFLLHRGKKKNAPALVADAVHLMTDVYSSLSVVIGLMLAFLTGLKIIDPLIAVCVGISLIWSGSSLAKEAIDGLMDA